jgi:hypothetical protein
MQTIGENTKLESGIGIALASLLHIIHSGYLHLNLK